MADRIKRPNWYDFTNVDLEDLGAEQNSYLKQTAESNNTALGTGVRLDSAEEPVIFDSSSLSATQSSWVSLGTFDGRGILAEAYTSSDLDKGSQISVQVTDALLNGYLDMTVTLLGKTFDDTLIYEHLIFENNGVQVTHNHFKEVTNVMFQNFLGNTNTSVDGYGSYDVGGTVVVSEASSMKVSLDLIAAQQTSEPDIVFRDYKVYDSGKSLQTVIEEAIGASNDYDDLNITTTATSSRTFAAGASTETIYGQKFQMQGTNIQKVTLLLALTSGSDWSGSLVVGIRKLQSSVTCSTDFLPDNEIDFDPVTSAIEELSLDQADLEKLGIVLDSTPQPVDFVFAGTNLANASLSGLEDESYYVITVRRTGSTTTGTLSLEEASNTDNDQKLTVFSNSVWTDVDSSSLWYQVWTDSVKVASGVAYDQGYQLVIPKTKVNNNGVTIQNEIQDLAFVDTTEDTENYVIVQKTLEYTDSESHPRTGDDIFSRVEDAPAFSLLNQDDTLELLETQEDLVILARVKDTNSKSNPEIAGTLDYPGLAIGNVINVINPGSDLLTQNVVGSIITPNILKPTLKYRIISQDIYTDLYGDVDNDSDIDLADANAVGDLDGYSIYFATTGTYTEAQHETLAASGAIDILELLRAEVDSSDGYEITSSDLTAVNAYIDSGTAFPNGASSFSRVRLEVEPLTYPYSELTSEAASTLSLNTLDPDLIDGSNFSVSSNIDFSIEFVSTWSPENVELLDLRRYVNTTFLTAPDIENSPENGGSNDYFIPGDLLLSGNVKNLDGSFHSLDHEVGTIEIVLPTGDTEGTINIFDLYVDNQMRFSDGTLVSSAAITNNQVRMHVSIGSHVKNVSGDDGYLDFDGYSDGYGANADEAIGTYLDHSTGLLRIRAYNIVHNDLFPELRTRIIVTVFLKKAGFTNSPVSVASTDIAGILDPIT